MASPVPLPTEVHQVKLYAKAIIGGVVSLTGSLAVAAVDNAITLGEIMAAVAAAAAAVGAVYGVSNGKASPG